MALPGLGPTDPAQADVREVYNYVLALEYGLAQLEHTPVNLWLMRGMHKLLLQGVRGQYRSPGDSAPPRIGSAGKRWTAPCLCHRRRSRYNLRRMLWQATSTNRTTIRP